MPNKVLESYVAYRRGGGDEKNLESVLQWFGYMEKMEKRKIAKGACPVKG